MRDGYSTENHYRNQAREQKTSPRVWHRQRNPLFTELESCLKYASIDAQVPFAGLVHVRQVVRRLRESDLVVRPSWNRRRGWQFLVLVLKLVELVIDSALREQLLMRAHLT